MNTKSKATKDQNEVKLLPVKATQEKPQIDPVKQENEIKALLTPTAEQRIKNARTFQLLTEKYERLKQKQDELNAFSVSSDGTEEKFRLSNSMGVAFEFSNTDVITDVIDVVRKHIDKRMETTNQQIIEFVI